MNPRYVLAPEAALDLAQIWRYIRDRATVPMADRVEAVIREKIVFLAGTSGCGHWRKDLTDEPVKFRSPSPSAMLGETLWRLAIPNLAENVRYAVGRQHVSIC